MADDKEKRVWNFLEENQKDSLTKWSILRSSIKKAVEEDPSAFAFDEVYDDMKHKDIVPKLRDRQHLKHWLMENYESLKQDYASLEQRFKLVEEMNAMMKRNY
ncbi:hypothetical protein Rs2_52594 [Raphanus sativus]|nr:hypothetical protein Rs2_52594 [Raphanus sativus]